MYTLIFPRRFIKMRKKLMKSGRFNDDILKKVIEQLALGMKLEENYKDHLLIGDLEGWRECHLGPDLLLVYEIYQKEQAIIFHRIGSHPEVFK